MSPDVDGTPHHAEGSDCSLYANRNSHLYEVARRTCHEAGLPWVDPRSGISYPPPRKEKKSKKAPPLIETPLQACVRIEKILRRDMAYHIAMDREGKVGLGQWLKKVIKQARRYRPG